MIQLCGCGLDRKLEAKDPFLSLYQMAPPPSEPNASPGSKGRLYDFSARDMDFRMFSQWFSDKTGFGIVYSASADKLLVSGEFRQVSPDDIISAISRRSDLELIKIGRTYFIGKLQPEDRGVLVRKVRGYDDKALTAAIQPFISQVGKAYVTSDCVIVVSDREAVLSRVSCMLDQLEASSSSTWILQFFVFGIKKNFELEGGGQLTTSGDVAYTVSKSKDGGTSSSFDFQNLGQSLTAVFNSSSSYIHMRAAPMMLVRDGATSVWSDGETQPIPEKTVSSYGTVTTTGYTNVDTGLVLKVSLRECVGGANLTLDFSESIVSGYVDYYPKVAKIQNTSSCQIQSGRIYLLAELNRKNLTDTISSVADMSESESGRRLQIWCKAYRVSGPEVSAPEWRDPKRSVPILDALEGEGEGAATGGEPSAPQPSP